MEGQRRPAAAEGRTVPGHFGQICRARPGGRDRCLAGGTICALPGRFSFPGRLFGRVFCVGFSVGL